MKIEKFEDIVAWQKGKLLTLCISNLISGFIKTLK